MAENPKQQEGVAVHAFIQRWTCADASERSNSQLFLTELCDLLGVPRPDPSFANGYAFEFCVQDQDETGQKTERRIDLYKRDCFVLESKQFQAKQEALNAIETAVEKAGLSQRRRRSAPERGSERWSDAMVRARGQAERYVRLLPEKEKTPPFLIVADVGDTFEIYADFSQAGKAYLPFPDPLKSRIRLADLASDAIRERLKLIWTDPLSLDPARKSADVTRDIAGYLAELAKSYEAAGHSPQTVADFLSRCLFCMFAEDVGLLPKDSFRTLLEQVNDDGSGFQELLSQLFREMNSGTGDKLSLVLRKKLLQFNGGLFADDTVLPVNKHQLILLRAACGLNWRNVEPAIFGTLLERALNPHDRHKLGAHYTPRAYVERLVLPTVIEPLRAEWDSVRAAALTHARLGKVDKAIEEVRNWHHKLCQLKVLDPACGSGNFLYVTLEHMKRLEGEVLLELEKYGDRELTFEMQHFSVDPHQFLGIEVNPRAASITELVLWIGYLQWHFRTRGQTMPAEPIIKKFKNIECRDAVLTWDGEPEPQRDEHGNIITIWDRRSYKNDLVTGREIPDESKRIGLLRYKNPRPAEWPKADYVVGNPPFLGPARMREALGDGYTETLWRTYSEVPESADYVMFWWHKAALLLKSNVVQRFGLITTNSISQPFNRKVMEPFLKETPKLSFAFVIPDHPWVDSADGADVRIAMTVSWSGGGRGILMQVAEEEAGEDGVVDIRFSEATGTINSDLTIGAAVTSTVELLSNSFLTSRGVMLFGEGFILTPEKAQELGLKRQSQGHRLIRPYINGRDLMDKRRNLFVIDLFGFTAEESRRQSPEIYQHVLTHVKPERDGNRDKTIRENWWLFGRPRSEIRPALKNLNRYVATVETAKHRVFVFLESQILADNKLIVIALDDAFNLGVLSSRIHVTYALAAGSWLGVGNDPVYAKSRCFDPFPFPDCTAPQRDRIGKIAEELDAHRKRVQAQHAGLTLTGMYNVLEKLRTNQPLTHKEKDIHDKALVSILKQLHDDLDTAVFDAYGWPRTLADAEILERVVTLNAQRARDEAAGHIRWLRPDYQVPLFQNTGDKQQTLDMPKSEIGTSTVKTKGKKGEIGVGDVVLPWPASLPDRTKAVLAEVEKRGGTAFTAEEIARSFKRAQTAQVVEILETLCAIGKARKSKDRNRYTA